MTELAHIGKQGRSLSAKQLRAIEALLVAPTIKDAALYAGVGMRTLHRWLKEDALFAETHHNARTDAFTRELGLLQNRLEKAIEVVDQALEGKASATQLRAAETTLKIAREAHETADLREEVELLKRMAVEDSSSPWGWVNRREAP